MAARLYLPPFQILQNNLFAYASCHRDILRKAVPWSWTDSLGCPSFPFALICRIGNNASNVSKVDVDLLFSRFHPFLGTLMNYNLVYESSQNLRC
jgi:hypothetical protein